MSRTRQFRGRLPAGDRGPGCSRGLSLAATAYLGLVMAVTAYVAVPIVARLEPGTRGWPTFLVLATAAAVAQIFVVSTTRDQSYHTAIVFLAAGVLLLPPELLVLMGVVQHVPEWLRERHAWYIQGFNICNYALNALAASAVYRAVSGHEGIEGALGDASFAIAALAACAVFVLLNHLLLATMLWLGRGHTWRETGLFGLDNLATELVLVTLGTTLAVIWEVNLWLIPLALAPLALIQRALHVPRLEEQARIDPKTNLANARHFGAVLTEEFARASRFERPLTVIMADLDLLRDINNAHGHLAGDAVLRAVAGIFREELRHYDLPARFGGEEFALLLPETSAEQAHEIAERIRAAVAARRIDVDTASEPLRATISMGVASFPEDGRDPDKLLHQADLAVYRAKLQGRNRVLRASPEPLVSRLAVVPAEEHPPPLRAETAVPPPAARPRSGPQGRKHPRLLTALRDLALRPGPGEHASLEQANALLRERSTAAMESLSETVDSRDSHTAGHSRRVQELALALGRELGLSRAELDLLAHAALFHDIGKLGVPDAVLLKPSTLSEAEWALMRRHADEGARLIDRLGFLADAVPAIRHHHERFDGTGYPDGLAGESIPLGARIIHVADAFDSMRMTRSYRAALPLGPALGELRGEAGRQFCPRCVDALERILDSQDRGAGTLLAAS